MLHRTTRKAAAIVFVPPRVEIFDDEGAWFRDEEPHIATKPEWCTVLPTASGSAPRKQATRPASRSSHDAEIKKWALR
jgi:hypothetical protein